MADSHSLGAQYDAIIDGIALLQDVPTSIPSVQVTRSDSARRSRSRRPSSSADDHQGNLLGRPSSRIGHAASSRQHTLSADYATLNSIDSQSAAAQPSFKPSLRTKTSRPESRERVSSAWAAPVYSVPVQQQHSQLAAKSWMPGAASLQPSTTANRTLSSRSAQPQQSSRQVTAPHMTKPRYSSSQHPSSESAARKLRPNTAQRESSARTVYRPSSVQQTHKHPSSTAENDAQSASHAMGMTLSQYMSQMPSREAVAGESWARPVSASLTAEDCRPPADMIKDDVSSIEDDESPGWRDDDRWGRSAGPQAPSPPGPEDATDFAPGSRHLSSARGNALDLRPATAAGVCAGQGSNSVSQDASSTRQTDLGSLSAQLFAPRRQSQDGCFRPPSRRLSRPSTAQRSGGRPMLGHALHAFHPPAAGSQAHAGSQHNQGLQIRGGRKVQSARPSERDQRPPSRQKPPPEALHLFQPVHGSSSGGFAPSPVFRAAAVGTARPSTSASIMQQAAGPRFKPSGSPVLHTGRMTLEDLQKLSQAAVSNSQALQAPHPATDVEGVPANSTEATLYANSADTKSYARPSSARPRSARLPSAHSPSAR